MGDIRSFLGLAGFYRTYVNSFSDKSTAMNALLKKDAEWNWTPECQQGFEAIKNSLCEAPVLALPDQPAAAEGTHPFVLQTDASDFALGGVLMQDTGDGLRPIAFESRTMNAAEQNYSTTEKELLALVHCCKIWRHYLEDSRWIIQGDHRPLQWLFSPGKDLTRRQARWVGYMQEMGATQIEHVPGTTIPVPDALSRRSDHPIYTPADGLKPGANSDPADQLRMRSVSDLLNPVTAWRHGPWPTLNRGAGMAWVPRSDPQEALRTLWQLHSETIEDHEYQYACQLHQVAAAVSAESSGELQGDAAAACEVSPCHCAVVRGCRAKMRPAGAAGFFRPRLYSMAVRTQVEDHQDWKLDFHEFHRWWNRCGGFDVDACCDPEGRNKLVSVFWSKKNSCLGQNWAGKRVWCNPPFNQDSDLILRILTHFRECWIKDPAHTSATFVLPEWDGPAAPWRVFMEEWGFKPLHTYPAQSPLFTSPGYDEPLLTKWPVTIWHYPAVEHLTPAVTRAMRYSAGVGKKTATSETRTLAKPTEPEPLQPDVPARVSSGPMIGGGAPVVVAPEDVRCKVCGRADDESRMLLCDGCDDGYHMFCLRPKLTRVPEGSWYCERCKPRLKGRPRRIGFQEATKVEREQRSVLRRFRDAYGDGKGQDAKIAEIRKLCIETPEDPRVDGYRVLGDLVWRMANGSYQLVVPEVLALREWALGQAHDGAGAGHLGRDKTYEKLSRRFWWRGMQRDVAEWCTTCAVCQFAKKRKHKPDGTLHPLPVPLARWQVVTVDFITGFPVTKSGYDAVATWTDKLSKMVHLVPYRFGDSSALNVARMYLDHIWKYHGAPLQVICDRDPRLVSSFFKDFQKLLGGTKISATTAYYPQGDGQSENTNQTVEQILRTLLDPHCKDWDQYLSQVEFAINDSVHAVHGYTPFQLNYGEHVRSSLDWILEAQRESPVQNFEAQRLVDSVRKMVNKAREMLLKGNQRMSDRGKTAFRDVTYSVGDRVVLATKNLEIAGDQGSKPKMRKPFCGPFTVTKVIKTTQGYPHAYRLRLPTHWKCHDVFKARYLEPYKDGSALFPGRGPRSLEIPELQDLAQEEIEKILADRVVKVRRGNRTEVEKQWLVRFKDRGPVGDKWFPIEALHEELVECPEWAAVEKVRRELREIESNKNPDLILVGLVTKRLAKVVRAYEGARKKAERRNEYIQAYEEGSRVEARLSGVTLQPEAVRRKLRVLVLFSGTGSVERVIHGLYDFAEVISVDCLPKWTPTHCVDILDWVREDSISSYTQYPPGYFDVIWASPPCREYSNAKRVGVRKLGWADACASAALKIIDVLRPVYWFIENPQGQVPFGLQFRKFMRPLEDYRKLCSYCKYGVAYRKNTNIWTNVPVELSRCSQLDGYCPYRKKHGIHAEAAQHGPSGKRKVKGIGSTEKAYKIPENLLKTLFTAMDWSRSIDISSRCSLFNLDAPRGGEM